MEKKIEDVTSEELGLSLNVEYQKRDQAVVNIQMISQELQKRAKLSDNGE